MNVLTMSISKYSRNFFADYKHGVNVCEQGLRDWYDFPTCIKRIQIHTTATEQDTSSEWIKLKTEYRGRLTVALINGDTQPITSAISLNRYLDRHYTGWFYMQVTY